MMNKLKNIDFLKVILTFAILWFHTVNFFGERFHGDVFFSYLSSKVINGDKALDFFFIISGFFLFCTFDKNKELIDFIKSKIIRLWPAVVFSVVVLYISNRLGILAFRKYDEVFSVLLMDNMGFTLHGGGNAPVWFVSTFFFVSILFFYIKQNFTERVFNLFVVLSVWFSYTFLVHINNGDVHGIGTTYGYIFNMGLLRGIGGMGLGYGIHIFYCRYQAPSQSIKRVVMFTLMEFGLLLFIIQFLLLINTGIDNYVTYILFFSMLFWLFLIKQGFLSKLFEKDIFSWMSKYTYSVFIMQWPVLRLLFETVMKTHRQFIVDYPSVSLCGAIMLCLMTGVICYYLVEVPSARYLKKHFWK